jgi:putative ABC transport system permease protein
MRQVMLSIDPNLLLLETHTMREHMSVMLLPATAGTTLVMVFCGLGLLLAAVGLYGVIAFSVARRTREIGIRIAIGARPGAVLAGVMRQGLTLAALGLITGFALAAVVAQVLAGLLYGISPIDPVAWGTATFVLLAVAALANVMPAYRAMQVDPSSALRAE